MARVRKDHEFVQHPRWEALGADAYLLHDAALAYVNATGSDGLVSKKRARTLHPAVKSPAARIRALLEHGMWTEHDPDTYRVCDVVDDLRHSVTRGDEQPSAAAMEKERVQSRQRKEQWRERRRNGVPNGSGHAPPVRHTATQPSPVQDPPGPGPALPAACDHGADTPRLCALCRAAATSRTGS
jgi:hypothetical protein